MKRVSLSVHRSNLQRIEQRELIRHLEDTVAVCRSKGNMVAFAVVAFDAEGGAFTSYDTGKIMPLWAFPAAVAGVIDKDIEAGEVEEDYRAPLRPVRMKK